MNSPYLPATNPDRGYLFVFRAREARLISDEQFVEACRRLQSGTGHDVGKWMRESGWIGEADVSMIASLLADSQVTVDPSTMAEAAAAGTGSHPPATVPMSTGRYQKVRRHGRGGIGDVWLSRDNFLERDVALKELREERRGDASHGVRFYREAKVTGRLEHPGIVPIYDWGRGADGESFYTMRFLRGRTLHEAISIYHKNRSEGKAAAADFRALLKAFVAVCNAVAYAHSRQVIHRDLKGQNVMLGDFGEVIVLDWGLAKVQGETDAPGGGSSTAMEQAEATRDGAILGTPAYMAPEQASGKTELVDARADIYALGGMLYATLTGRPPFTGSASEVMRQIREAPPTPPCLIVRDAPKALQAVCLKALAKDPGQRYASAQALAADVEHWLADEPTSVYAEPLAQRLARWSRRHRAAVFSAIAILVIAVVTLTCSTILIGNAKAETDRAYGQAKAQREKAEANAADALLKKAEAEEQRREALTNFRLARAAVDQFHTQVSENQLLNVPGLQELRKSLLKSAQDFYEKFTQVHPDHPEVRLDYARSLFRLGAITAELDSQAAAIPILKKTLAALKDAPAAHREEAGTILGACLHSLGISYHRTRQSAQAQASFEEALATYQSLNSDERLPSLRNTYAALGLLHFENGRPREAEKVYREALRLGEELANTRPGDSLLTIHRLQTYANLGNILRESGRGGEALPFYDKAVALGEKLKLAYPGSPTFEGRWVWARSERTHLLLLAGDFKKAENDYTSVVATQKKLAEENPLVKDLRQEWALSLSNLAMAQDGQSKSQAALDNWAKCKELFEELLKTDPENVEYQHGLGAALHNSGAALFKLGQPAKSLAQFVKAVEIRERLVQKSAFGLHHAQLGSSYNNLGYVNTSIGDFGQAAYWFEKGVKIIEETLAKEPNLAEARAYHLRTLAGLGQAYTGLGKHAPAVAIWERALPLAQGEERVNYRIMRASNYAHLGDHVKATDEIAALAKLTSADPAFFYDAACVCALSAGAASKDEMKSADERERLAESYAAQALAHLRRACTAGFFLTPAGVQTFRNDSDFEPIKARDDFKAFVAEVEKKK